MCGICGKLSWGQEPDAGIVERMTGRLAHRGPDSGRVTALGPLVLGHRRLAIIDLSPAGDQPMSDVTGRYWLVFNGEIYNFAEIRTELEGLGSCFRSHSDSEVILESYKRWGVECLQRFNGMFAFALWDAESRRLFMARDRLGKKPLFYWPLPDGGVLFASELKALCEDPAVPRVIDPAALGQYLSLSYTLTYRPILAGVQKLPPGHYLVVEPGHPLRPRSYWDIAARFREKRRFASEGEAVEAVRSLFDDAVRLRLVSDVPLGMFLSGGVDSSAVCASMCRLQSPRQVRTFSMGFREKTFSELDEARAVATFLGVDHREQIASDDAAELLPRIVFHADEPFADTSMIPMFLLAAFARQHVTVCLTGDGGDEVFAGYETYTADQLHHLAAWLPGWGARAAARVVDAALPVSHAKVSLDYKVRRFVQGLAYPSARAHYHWRTIFSEDEKRQLLEPEVWAEAVREDPAERFLAYDAELHGCHYLDRAMYVDLKTWLVDDILVKADRATMAHGLEARAPMLDHRLVELAASLPVDMKVKGFRKKHLFKASQAGRLPRWVLTRKKVGFNSPISHWITTSFRDRFGALTYGERGGGGIEGIFQPEFVHRLWREHETRRADHSLKLLAMINLQLWADQSGAALG